MAHPDSLKDNKSTSKVQQKYVETDLRGGVRMQRLRQANWLRRWENPEG